MANEAMRRLSESVESARSRIAALQNHRDARFGFWVDDPANPGVAAFVFQGKLVELIIPNNFLKLPSSELQVIVNSVIRNAFLSWSPSVQAEGRL